MSHLRWQGLSFTEIVRQMDRHRSTIYRELARNSRQRTDGAYRPTKANDRARSRRSHSRRNRRYDKLDFKVVRALLRKKWSPEQIHGHLKRVRLRIISHETIYQYVGRDRAEGGNIWTHLRQSPKQRRKRYRSYDSRGRLADKRHISQRPASVEPRRYKGHWEIDTVMSRGSTTDCIVTLSERKTGFVMIGKLSDKSTHSLNKKAKRVISRDLHSFKTISADNGTEFPQHKAIEAATNVRFYFANPFHSRKRGSNENVNGLIRQYLPKGTNMAKS